MKFLKIFFISVFIIILVLIIALFIFIQTVDINRFKPKIIEQASAALKHKVDFERAKLSFNFKQGINLKVYNFYISELQPYGNGDFLSIKEISFGIDIFGYFLQKKIIVPSVIIDTLRVKIIRQSSGNMNVNTFVPPVENNPGVQKNENSNSSAANIPLFLISSLEIINSNVFYSDQMFNPEVKIDVNNLKVNLSRISLNQAIPFIIEASVFSNKTNIHIEGNLQYDLASSKLIVSDLKAKTDLANLMLDKLLESLPMLRNDNFPTKLQGKLDFNIKKLEAGAKGMESLDSKLMISQGLVELKALAIPISDLNAEAKITEKNIVLDKVAASLKDGKLLCNGVIDDYIVKQAMDLKINAQDLKVQELVNQEKSSVKIEGAVSADMALKAAGFTPEAFTKTLLAEGNVKMVQGKIKDINVLKSVLDQVSVISGLSEKMQQNLSDRYKSKLTQKDTNLLDINLPVKIENSKIIVSDTVIGAEEFLFKTKALAGFDGSYNLEGAFIIPKELSAAMVASVNELEYLLNPEKEIYIPLKVAGNSSGVNFTVDLEYMGKQIVVNQGAKQLTDVLDKALGLDKNSEKNESQATTKELVGNVLDKLFK